MFVGWYFVMFVILSFAALDFALVFCLLWNVVCVFFTFVCILVTLVVCGCCFQF